MNKIFQKLEEFISVVVLSVMTILTFINVISRYFLKASISFTDELTTFLFVLLSLLGSAIAARYGSHLGLTILTDYLPEKFNKWVAMFSGICSVIFCGVIVYYGLLMVSFEFKSMQLTLGMQWPEWIFGSFVPIGGMFILYEFANSTIKILKKKDGE
ncbi:TRAP transporter small permease [Sedimentibacter hydroxybenzoicus DSM 7310]|uniref:TRAP transporter small permease n=1 Tax=Sedimentibacter hydroxybenzoicus DSM 7310 TaxID=1123245 RepID=A0A974BLB0_SEDHY|nr:TRAP transporter small permease [Sedimentibacter hydroxybenzoicus]NYB74941.1 TRAP transporter small permease [Sedimentibacter hydroxybenzoicus DSM 7310]